jgi:hypothetical protein
VFVIHGAYHLRPRRIAFRNDYCVTCGATTRSVQVRTFDVGHIFWIPVLPVGFWKHWLCTFCGRQPHAHRGTSRLAKWAWLGFLLLLSVVFWVEVRPTTSDSLDWAMGIGASLGAVLLFVHLLRLPQEPSLKQLLATVQPAADTVCPFCGTQLLIDSRCSCPSCGVLRC